MVYILDVHNDYFHLIEFVSVCDVTWFPPTLLPSFNPSPHPRLLLLCSHFFPSFLIIVFFSLPSFPPSPSNSPSHYTIYMLSLFVCPVFHIRETMWNLHRCVQLLSLRDMATRCILYIEMSQAYLSLCLSSTPLYIEKRTHLLWPEAFENFISLPCL